MNEKIKGILEIFKPTWNNEAILADLAYCAFFVSLIPIPGIQQSAQILDRIIANKELSVRFNEVWEEIKLTNSKL
jgi:hypothetical protein